MRDYGHDLRQKFIAESTSLDAKRAALRERLHREGKALVGEEVEGQKNGWAAFEAKTGWRK